MAKKDNDGEAISRLFKHTHNNVTEQAQQEARVCRSKRRRALASFL